MRRIIPLLAVFLLLLCGCTQKQDTYYASDTKGLREFFVGLQPDRQTIAQTEPPEDAAVVTPMVPFE